MPCTTAILSSIIIYNWTLIMSTLTSGPVSSTSKSCDAGIEVSLDRSSLRLLYNLSELSRNPNFTGMVPSRRITK